MIYQIINILIFIILTSAYINPTQSFRDTPDPGVVYDNSFYYAATTGGWDENFYPIWQSQDLTNWKQVGWGILKENRPVWSSQDFWAPQIHIINNLYYLYYTARDKTGKLCIGVAYSEKAQGPYTHQSHPLVRNQSEGVIDATVFRYENQIYLIYKVDGNAHGNPTPIFAVKLSNDGFSVIGEPTFLLTNTLSWERGIVEAPWIIEYDHKYYLFYSSCGYNNKCYSVGVARSSQFLGTYEKYPVPILHTRQNETEDSWQGPGHCSVLKTKKGNYAMVYHAWPHNKINTKRLMLLDEIKWSHDGWPIVNDGSPSQKEMPIF